MHADYLVVFSLGVQAFCRNCFWPTHLPTNFLRRGLINLSTHLKNVVMGDSGSWKVTPGVFSEQYQGAHMDLDDLSIAGNSSEN